MFFMIIIQDYKVDKVYIPFVYLTESGIYLHFPNCQINDWDFKKNLYDILAELQKRTEQPLRSFFVLTGADPEIECYYCSNSTVFERYDMTVEEVLEFEHELGNVIFDEIQLQELKSVFENMKRKVKTDIYGNTYIYKNGEYVETSEKDSELLFKLTLFGGWLGLHLFYQKKILSGILYLFTLGIFGIGWTLDLVAMLTGSYKDKEKLYLYPLEDRRKKLLCCIVPLVLIPVFLFGYQKAFTYVNQSVAEKAVENLDGEELESYVDHIEQFEKGD